MSRAKRGNAKKSFMREHDCRFCLYFGSCAHKECMFDELTGEGEDGVKFVGNGRGDDGCVQSSDSVG